LKRVNGLERALEKCVQATFKAVSEGHNIIILSDRGVSEKWLYTNAFGLFLYPSFTEYTKSTIEIRNHN
jgi:hypothetical protein